MAEQPDYTYDVFISYSHADRTWVRGELVPRLEAAGLRACVDYRDFRPGAPSVKELERAVLDSRKTLLVLTPDYVQSTWTVFDALLLQTLDPANRDLRLIPLLKAECDLPLGIRYLTYVNFADPDDPDWPWTQLLTALGAPPSSTPAAAQHRHIDILNGQEMGHVFLSYSRRDADFMRRLKADLSTAGLDAWTDETGLEPGTEQWEAAIANAIEHAGCLVVILSPEAKQSPWVARELNYAEIFGVRIFPVLVSGDERSSIPIRLISTQRIDAHSNYREALQKLVVILRKYLDIGQKSASHSHTTVITTTITLPVHVVESALVQQYNSTYNMTYYHLDRGRYDPGRVENRAFTVIVLENDYLKLTILPELGGRIYQVIFKATGHNMFYQNPVLKPSPWGPPEMGWWLAAGGMEWCLPVEEHGYEWGIPWHYAINERADGVTVTVWDTDVGYRLRAGIAITLLNGEALFHVTPTIQNPTANPADYKFWLNAMLAPGGANAPSADLRFLMPTSEVTVDSTGDPRLPSARSAAGWPVCNDVDWSRLGNWQQWFGFFQRPQATGDFLAVYDEGYDEGVIRIYDSRIAEGASFFAYGWGTQAIQPDLYTDDHSAYVEMYGGVRPTSADMRRLEAGQRLTWEERWYPVAGLGGLTWANTNIALFVKNTTDATSLHVATTRPRSNIRVVLIRRSDNTILLDDRVAQVIPGQPYQSPLIKASFIPLSDMEVLVYSGDTQLGAYPGQITSS